MHPPQRPAPVDDAGGQTASSPRGQQHVSTGHEDLREGATGTPTHTPPKTPLNPTAHNVHDETRQTPGREPPTQPLREAQPGHAAHGHRPNSEHHPFSRQTSTVLTTNKYRSHEQ